MGDYIYIYIYIYICVCCRPMYTCISEDLAPLPSYHTITDTLILV